MNLFVLDTELFHLDYFCAENINYSCCKEHMVFPEVKL